MAEATAFIGLGSNLQQPLGQVEQAVIALGALPHSNLVAVSPWYSSRPVGPGDQADYINGVAQIVTRLAPLELLNHLQAIEASQGRRRLIKWGPRTLDLDLLLYGDLTLNSERLVLPHPLLTQRNFVVKPLWDLAPELTLPTGENLTTIWRELGDTDLIPLPAELS